MIVTLPNTTHDMLEQLRDLEEVCIEMCVAEGDADGVIAHTLMANTLTRVLHGHDLDNDDVNRLRTAVERLEQEV